MILRVRQNVFFYENHSAATLRASEALSETRRGENGGEGKLFVLCMTDRVVM